VDEASNPREVIERKVKGVNMGFKFTEKRVKYAGQYRSFQQVCNFRQNAHRDQVWSRDRYERIDGSAVVWIVCVDDCYNARRVNGDQSIFQLASSQSSLFSPVTSSL